jgi:hypothetical protein
MPWVGSEATIPVSKWTKTVPALDREATVIDYCNTRTQNESIQ